jgi:hypothetical protein
MEGVTEKESASLAALRALLEEHSEYSVMDVESKKIWAALSTTLHAIARPQYVWRVLEGFYSDNEGRPRRQFRLLELIDRWLKVGAMPDDLLLREMQSFLQRATECTQKAMAQATLATMRNYSSPVVGRWRLMSPRDAPLQVLEYSASDVAAVTSLYFLTARIRKSDRTVRL